MFNTIILSLLLAGLYSVARSEVFSGDEITMLANGAIVHTKYKVEPADHLVHLHLEDQIVALTCAENHVLINATGNFHSFDDLWQNGSIL